MIRCHHGSLDYVFVDEWRIAADAPEVDAVIRAVQEWPAWWPSALSVEPLDGERRSSWRFTFSTRLPYLMVFDAEVVGDDPVAGVRTRVSGRVEGSGCWRTVQIEGGTLVRFDWRVRPRVRWMRLVSLFARPAFGWNHASLMEEGGQALADRLRTTLLAPVVTRLLDSGVDPGPVDRT